MNGVVKINISLGKRKFIEAYQKNVQYYRELVYYKLNGTEKKSWLGIGIPEYLNWFVFVEVFQIKK